MKLYRSVKSFGIFPYGMASCEKYISPCSIYNRKFLSHYSISPETLLYRFYNFFSKSPKYSRYVVDLVNSKSTWGMNKLAKSDSSLPENLNSMTCTELQKCVISLTNDKRSNYLIDLKGAVRSLDKICSERIDNLAIEDVLKLNYSWLGVLGTNITNLKYFSRSLEKFKSYLHQNLSPQVIILILFYAGFFRKNHEAKEIIPVSIAQLCMKEILDELSTIEITLVANIAFKTGTKIIDPSFLSHLVAIMNKNLRKFVADPALFVTLIKTMRHNKFWDYTLLKNIEKCFSTDKSLMFHYNLTAKVHLLALYADALYGKHEFVSHIITSITRNMLHSGSYKPYEEKSKNPTASRVRAKDLARLLWAASYLGFKLNPDVVEKNIIPVIQDKALNGLYEKRLGVLIDSVLSLWIMGHKPVGLLPYIFSKKTISYLSDSKRIRYNFRLQLLFTCISIETPEVIKDMTTEIWPTAMGPVAEEKVLLRYRSNLLNVLQVVKSIGWRFGVVDVKCESAIPHLNLPGIILKTSDCCNRSDIHVEVLDESNCLYETDIPNGLILLKLRLLRQLGHQVILVNYSEHRNNQSNLISYLEDEINKIR